MKKLVLAVSLVVGLMTNGWGEEGTITSINIQPDRTDIVLDVAGTPVWSPINTSVLNGDQLKAFIAAALTAKSSGATVELVWQDSGWIAIKLK